MSYCIHFPAKNILAILTLLLSENGRFFNSFFRVFFILYIIFTLIVIYAKFLWYFETCLLFRNTTFLIYKINYIEEKRRVALNHFYVYQYSFQLLEPIRCEMFIFSALHKKQKSSIITLCFYSFHLFLFKVVELLSTKSACKRKH